MSHFVHGIRRIARNAQGTCFRHWQSHTSNIYPAYVNETAYWKIKVPPLSLEDDTSGFLEERASKLNAIYAAQTDKKKQWLDKFRNKAASAKDGGAVKTDKEIIDNVVDELNKASSA